MVAMRRSKEWIDDAPVPGFLEDKSSAARGVSHRASAKGRALDLDAPPVIKHQIDTAVLVTHKGGSRA